MSGGVIKILSEQYKTVTGDDKYDDAWRNPISTLTGGEKELPEAATPGTDPALDEKARADRDEELRKRLRMKDRGGRASTILTSGLDKLGGSSAKRALFGE